jgi:hypothetical protein
MRDPPPNGWPGGAHPHSFMNGHHHPGPTPWELGVTLGRMSAEQARQTEIALALMSRIIELPDKIAAAMDGRAPSPPPAPPASPPATSSDVPRLGSFREWLTAAAAVGVLISVLLGKTSLGEAFDLLRKVYAPL